MIGTFEGYEVDTRLFELRRQGVVIPLEPQVFEILAYLVQHHDRMVSKDEVIGHVWPDRYISESALSSRIMSARKAIGDSGREQRLIRTVHGRGYRFLGNVRWLRPDTTPPDSVSDRQAPAPVHQPEQDSSPPTGPALRRPRGTLLSSAVGRESELSYLHTTFNAALNGRRQIVFVTGEAGLGKTTLVEVFLDEVGGRDDLLIGLGQCLEHQGAGEAYMPVLEALGRMARASGGEALITLLAERAPMWLIQMPWLVGADELGALERRAAGAGRERMLREMAEWIEVVTATRPLVLVLEDLQWADTSTVDLLTWLGRRTERSRLLVIGTYRPADLRSAKHPLHTVQQELRIRGQCVELAVSPLAEAAVARYLTERFGSHAFPAGFAEMLRDRAGGNPLFMAGLLDAWVEEGLVMEQDGRWSLRSDMEALSLVVPTSLRSLIEHQLDRLAPEEQGILEAASVAGPEFSAAAVAAALELPDDAVEMRCAALARQRRFLRDGQATAWPDGTVTTRFGFAHVLYRDTLYERIPAGRLVRIHRRIGARIEEAYGAQERKPAAELALHFGRGRDPERAAHYLHLAARQALRRTALQEAEAYLRQALEIVTGPLAAGRARRIELDVRAALGAVLFATRGWRSPEAESVLTEALNLAQAMDDTAALDSIGLRLASVRLFRGQQAEGDAMLERLDPSRLRGSLRLAYHSLNAVISFQRGAFAEAAEHGAYGLRAAEPDPEALPYALPGEDLAIGCRAWRAQSLWYLGFADQALREMRATLEAAQTDEPAYSLTTTFVHRARLAHLRREPEAAVEFAGRAIAAAEEYGYVYPGAFARIVKGWALVAQGLRDRGLDEMEDGLRTFGAIGGSKDHAYALALHAQAQQMAGRRPEALETVEEAVAALPTDGQHFFEAEIHHLHGMLLLEDGDHRKAAAEASLRTALNVARRQEARSLELRAAVTLSRLQLRRGEREEAHTTLAPLLGWFTEGYDTLDLQEAAALLEEIAATA